MACLKLLLDHFYQIDIYCSSFQPVIDSDTKAALANVKLNQQAVINGNDPPSSEHRDE